jgi:hypothetical protein
MRIGYGDSQYCTIRQCVKKAAPAHRSSERSEGEGLGVSLTPPKLFHRLAFHAALHRLPSTLQRGPRSPSRAGGPLPPSA